MQTIKVGPGPQPADAVQLIGQRLEELGIRLTRGRRLVLRALQGSSGPQSASELAGALASVVPLSSIYRTLSVLDEAGVLERLHDPNGIARYELSEWLTGHHDHLVCVECGATEDVELSSPLERTLGSFADDLEGRSGFQISGHSLRLEGLCEECR